MDFFKGALLLLTVRLSIAQPPTPQRHEHEGEEKEREEAGENSSSSATFFTDKLLAWDASTALAQDFALAMHGAAYLPGSGICWSRLT